MKLPIRFNYAEAYLTLRCGLGCSYCINNDKQTAKGRTEISAEEWAAGLNKIDFGDVPLTLGGGEPAKHKNFYQILQGLRPNIKVELLTNLQFDLDEFMREVMPSRFTVPDKPAYRSIRVSYHPDKMDAHKLVRDVRKLWDAGYPVGIFGLNRPSHVEENMHMAEIARKNQVYFFVKDFLGKEGGELYGHFKYPSGLDGWKKRAVCRTKELLIAPDGKIHRCHRDLYRGENPIGDILDELAIEDKFRPCANYGECNPCDVKLKTNRFLQGGSCQVDIGEVSDAP